MAKTCGFLLGKFMPLHEGHVLLFDVASSLVDELIVLVCTRDCEPIDGQLRYEWVRQSVKSNVRVLHLHQDIPQEPAEHSDFWTIWRSTIQNFCPAPIDMVFGSENYVVRLAKELNASPFIVDLEREVIPVSSTMIRNDCRTNWKYIPRAVRPYYQKRMCILGPESTGKSTLSKHLANAFNTGFIPEYGRTHDAIFRQGKNWSANDFISIAKGHIALGNGISKQANFICFEDTDLLQTVVWAEYLLGIVPSELLALLSEWHPADFYLLLKPDVSWVDDGTRYSGESKTRNWFFNRLRAHLEEMDIPHQIIDGPDWKQRTNLAKRVVADFIE